MKYTYIIYQREDNRNNFINDRVNTVTVLTAENNRKILIYLFNNKSKLQTIDVPRQCLHCLRIIDITFYHTDLRNIFILRLREKIMNKKIKNILINKVYYSIKELCFESLPLL